MFFWRHLGSRTTCLWKIFPSRTLGNLIYVLSVVIHISAQEAEAVVIVALGHCRKCGPGSPNDCKHFCTRQAGPWTALPLGILGNKSQELRVLSGTSAPMGGAVDVVLGHSGKCSPGTPCSPRHFRSQRAVMGNSGKC